jgi:acyl dehydratase
MAFEFDRSIVGEEFDRSEYGPVSAAELIAFGRSLGETHPCYVEPGPGLVAHPTYCVRFRGARFFPDDLPESLRARMSFDAGKDIEFGGPIRPGDRVTVVSTLHDLYEKTGRSGGMIFVVVRLTLTNQRGELIATVDNRLMYRGDEPA